MLRLFKCVGIVAGLLLVSGFASSRVTFENLPVFEASKPAKLTGVLTRPDGAGRFPAVVLWHTCAGVDDVTDRLWPEFLARKGYVTLAIDSLGPRGVKSCFPFLTGNRGRDREIVAGDAHGALRYLAGQPFVDADRVALMGLSFGAIMVTYLSARDIRTPEGHGFKAMVGLYGHCSLGAPGTGSYPGVPKQPWLIVNGALERPAMIDGCRAIEGRPNVTFRLIEDAYHAFDNPKFTRERADEAGNKMLYSRAATDKAQALVAEFLAAHLGRR